MAISIFDLEKRTDLRKECLRLHEYLSKKNFILTNDYSVWNNNFWNMVNICFTYWPYRYTALNIQEFFDIHGLPFNVDEMNNEQLLYYLQIILDFIMWLYTYDESNPYVEENKFLSEILYKNEKKLNIIIENIELTIEQANYKIEKVDQHYIFIKRNVDLDSILKQFETKEDIRITLLSYNDFRIEKSIDEKRMILKRLADWLEPQKNKFTKIDGQLTDDIFYLLNSIKIRHNNSKQVNLDDDSLLALYDDLFKMIIHLIRSEDIKRIQSSIQNLKK